MPSWSTREGNPILLVAAASLQGVNGDQRVATVALAYDKAGNRSVKA